MNCRTQWYFFSALVLVACGTKPLDPKTAQIVQVDRFKDTAGHLQRRSANSALPAANAPVDFDQAPFITQGYGPKGEIVQYYNFDIQPVAPAPIFVFFYEGASSAVEGQLNIIDSLPGDAGYNDFWQVNKVTVPANYQANTLTSAAAVIASGYKIEVTSMLVNCPVVPEGSTAKLRLGTESNSITHGWYRNQIVPYFTFGEKALTAVNNMVPTAPIYVSFTINPKDATGAPIPNGGPASGFKTETGSAQTHNVVQVLPTDPTYSPLWEVKIYDNNDFAQVHDLADAQKATVQVSDAGAVNCPVVSIANR